MTYIIAEVGSSHDGSLGQACRFVQWAARAGADAVKCQDHRWQPINGKPHPKWFSGPDVETRSEYIRRTCLDGKDWTVLSHLCKDVGVDLIVSPFSVESARSLSGIVDAFKVASGQVTNLPLLRELRELGKPVYLSSGMSTMDEVGHAMDALGGALRCIMQCTSEYPCRDEHVMLRDWRQERFPYGLSDHTLGMAASLGAIALGATVIERHVCWSRHGYGSDARHSLEPAEFEAFAREARSLDRMLASNISKDEMAERLSDVRKEFMG